MNRAFDLRMGESHIEVYKFRTGAIPIATLLALVIQAWLPPHPAGAAGTLVHSAPVRRRARQRPRRHVPLCPARPPPPTVLNGAVRVLGLPSTTPPCGTFRQGSTSTDQRPCEISWRGHASVRGSVAASPIQARFASVHRYSCLARNVAARFPWRGGFRPRHPQNRGKRP